MPNILIRKSKDGVLVSITKAYSDSEKGKILASVTKTVPILIGKGVERVLASVTKTCSDSEKETGSGPRH